MKNCILILVSIMMTGCLDYPTEWDIELWEQKIENSNLSIYKFDAWGGRDTHMSGLKIIETSKGFTQNDVTNKDEFVFLKSIPNKVNLEVIKTVRPKEGNSNTPITEKIYQLKGVKVHQESYEYNGSVTGICTLKRYYFKSFEETRDSLIFFHNKSQSVSGKNFDRISIPKGNVYLMTSIDNLKLARVVYSDLVLFEDEKKSNGIKICRMTKYFDPIDEIDADEFSDYGIYKPVK